MELVEYDKLTHEKVIKLVEVRASFQVVGIGSQMSEAVELIERAIESKSLSCRVYTYGRVAAAGGSFFGGITGILGIGSAVAMAAHNLVTLNPDYEIAKHQVDRKLTIKYCK